MWLACRSGQRSTPCGRTDKIKKIGVWRTPVLDWAHLRETSLKRRSGDGWRHLEAPAASVCVQTCLFHISEERRKTAFLLAAALIKRLGVSPLGRYERLSPLPVIYKQHTCAFPIEMISRRSSEATRSWMCFCYELKSGLWVRKKFQLFCLDRRKPILFVQPYLFSINITIY